MATNPSKKPDLRGKDTRSALIAAGRRLFAAHGFDGTSVRALTREAGTNLGAVTYHFSSKRRFYQAVLRESLTPLVDKVSTAADGAGTPLDRLEAVVDIFFEHLAETPEVPRLLLQEVAAGKAPPEEVLAILRRNVGNVRRILAAGTDDGSIRPGAPMLMAISVMAQPVFMSLMAPVLNAIGGIDLKDRATRNEAAHHVKTFVRAGLTPREELHS